VRHINWLEQYKALRAAFGIHYPGYMIHESAQYSEIHRRWFFMPRRASHEVYTETEDEQRGQSGSVSYMSHDAGSNVMLIADDDFAHVEARTIGKITPARGFSAFQFIPGTISSLIMRSSRVEDRTMT
jgi:soluble calcium-activated nucleotidase 1